MRDIYVFESDTVRHISPFVVVSRSKINIKINKLNFIWRTHNPLVLGSSPSGPTIKIKELRQFTPMRYTLHGALVGQLRVKNGNKPY